MSFQRVVLSTVAFVGLMGGASALAADSSEAGMYDDVSSPSYSGAYIAARVAGAFTNDTDFNADFTNFSTEVTNEYESSTYAGAVAVGYRFEDMFSVELELGMTNIEVEAHTLQTIPTATDTISVTYAGDEAFGEAKITYGMVNIVAEQETDTFFRPFFTTGLGLADVEIENYGVVLPGPLDPFPAGPATVLDESDLAMAWQLGGGVIVDVTQKASVELGYRYFRIEDIDVVANTEDGINLSQHQVMVGLRYHF